MQPNKAIVGRNAFAHESGIHQDGVLKERSTYEIMDATTVGLDANSLVLGKHSGPPRAARALQELGFTVDGQALNTAFKRFKEIADKKKQVSAMDLEALVTDELRDELRAYTLEWFDVEASTRRPPHATVELARRTARPSAATSPATARSTRSSAPSTPPPAARRACASSGSTRSRAARTRSARPASCSRSRASPPAARASRPTSSRPPRSRTSARSPTPSARVAAAADPAEAENADPPLTPPP